MTKEEGEQQQKQQQQQQAYASYYEIDDSFVLLKDGISVQYREEVGGRTAVASKQFVTLYQKILREKPAIIIDGNYYNFLQQFDSACTKQTRDSVLDMYHPPLTVGGNASELVKRKFESAKRLHQQILSNSSNSILNVKKYNLEFIHKLLTIFACNAHEYTGGGNSDNKNSKESKAALFIVGSKIAHSCHPNLAYTSRTHDGALEYRIIRTPINAGDTLNFSYISRNLYKIPTYKRRHFLQKTKDFFCYCQRCSGADYCRVVTCTTCCQSKSRRIPCVYDTQTFQPTWICSHCKTDLKDTPAKLEKKLEQHLTSILLSIQQQQKQQGEQQSTQQLLQAGEQQLQDLIKQSTKLLSSTHHITITAMEYLAPLLYNNQQQQQQQQERLVLAVSTACQAIAASECVAAQCTGGDCGSSNSSSDHYYFPQHDPLYDRALACWDMALNLLKISPRTTRPKRVVKMVQRYLPVLKGYFYYNDDNDDSTTTSSSHTADQQTKILLQTLEREFGTKGGGGGGGGGDGSNNGDDDEDDDDDDDQQQTQSTTKTTATEDNNNNNNNNNRMVKAEENAATSISSCRRCCSSCGKSNHSSTTNTNTNTNKPLLRCSRCQGAWYCNRDCQIKHWKSGHKKQCQQQQQQQKQQNST